MEKFILKQTESALYEVWAEDYIDAREVFSSGDGDFIGWEDDDTSITVEKEEEYGRRLSKTRRQCYCN